MTEKKKTFAFKLSDRKRSNSKWQIRDGVSVAGCSDASGDGEFRYHYVNGSRDDGAWC